MESVPQDSQCNSSAKLDARTTLLWKQQVPAPEEKYLWKIICSGM